MFCLQVQDKFRLDLSDEEAVHYMQSLIDESVGALFAAVVEQIHKFAQVSDTRHTEGIYLAFEWLTAKKDILNVVLYSHLILQNGPLTPG